MRTPAALRHHPGGAPKAGRWPGALLVLLLLGGSGPRAQATPSTAQGTYLEGRRAYQAGQYGQAYRIWKQLGRDLLDQGRHRDPQQVRTVARLHFLVGAALFRGGKYQGAALYWRRTLSLDPGDSRARRGLDRLARAGRIEASEVSPDPHFPPEDHAPAPPVPSAPPPLPAVPAESPDILAGLPVVPDEEQARLAWESFRQARDGQDPEAARTALRRARAAGASLSQVDYELGHLYLQAELPGLARLHLERCLAQGEEDASRLHLALGKSYSLEGDRQAEITEFEKALREDPDYAEAHMMLAVAYDQVGNSPRVLEHAQRAIRIDPGLKDELRRRLPDSDLGKKLESLVREVVESSRKERLTDELIEEFADRLARLLGEENLRSTTLDQDRQRFAQALGKIRDGEDAEKALKAQFDHGDRTRFLKAFRQNPEMRRTLKEFDKVVRPLHSDSGSPSR